MDTRKVYEALRVSQVRIHPIIAQCLLYVGRFLEFAFELLKNEISSLFCFAFV